MIYNRDWEPWYGMFNYGDVKTYSYGNDWRLWNNNEPGQDFIRWLHFMRTGNKEIYKRLEKIIYNIFNKGKKFKLNLNSDLSKIKNFDSLNNLNLMFAVQKEFNVKFTIKDFSKIKKIKHIISKIN